MKAKKTLLAIGLFGALQAVALGEPTNSVLSASVAATSTTNSQTHVQPKLGPTYPTAEYKLVKPTLAGQEGKDKIIRLGNESSQAWATIASQQPNPTLVHNLSTHEPKFCLVSFGHDPWP
ncbi:MAG TPA: hypothetical protein VFF11_01140 [Candidatus Binatia bacterium]|nr:hypothetical protein [Candidatus Binatia bacterium]